MAIKNSILETIGNTPIVRIQKLGPKHVELFVKVEAFNPAGSVKDRLALGVIEAAEADGSLQPGQTVVEATSGNTGIGLAMVCAQKGYPLVVTMAENFSVERRKLMRFLGAKVVLTPASDKGTGMLKKAEELAAEHGWFLTRQFENEAREILADFADGGLDYWVTGAGTGGTLKGVARVLRAESPATKVVVAEPDNVPLLSSGIPQERDAEGRPSGSHPTFRPHLMQGWIPDFIPKLAETALEAGAVDSFQPVGGDETMQCCSDLATKEGIFCGTTGGATFAAALRVAETAPEGSRILAMLPATGERYLTTPLFAEVSATMTQKEIAISNSTKGYRFGGGGAVVVEELDAEPKPEIAALVAKTLSDKDEPVVMYALEWCEFCWSVRNMFAEAGIRYHSVDLDSFAYQKDNLGGDIRTVLRKITGNPTIPQILVGGQHIGGATETVNAFNDGSFKSLLTENSVEFDPSMTRDAYSFLPTWLHPR